MICSILQYRMMFNIIERSDTIMNEIKIPRMETIRRTAELFGLPVHFVRTKVSSGEVVAVRAGKRFLVNVDKFAEYLNSSTVQPDLSACSHIQPIGIK